MTRQAHRPQREPVDSAWTDVAVIAWSILGLLLVYVLATALPR